jgi:lipopolysaccharide export system protein LptA
MQLETDKNFQGTKLKEPVPLTIHWNESMFFNGQFAEFRGGIQAEQENARLACQYLQVELDRPVSLKQGEKRDSPPAKVDRLVCDGSVRVEEAVLDAGSLVKYQRLESPSVAVDNAAGTVHASGPGLVRLLQPGAAEGPALPGSRPVAGRSAAVTSKPPEPVLKLTWVRFFGSMYANNKNHTATFRQNVEVVHLPSDDPNLEPNVDKLPEGGMYIRADVLTVYSRGNAERGSQEMEARGNVLVRANEFWARADEVHYNEAKDQVILKANLGSVVSLYRRTAEGGAWQESRSKEVIYSRKTGKFDLIGGRGVQGGN